MEEDGSWQSRETITLISFKKGTIRWELYFIYYTYISTYKEGRPPLLQASGQTIPRILFPVHIFCTKINAPQPGRHILAG